MRSHITVFELVGLTSLHVGPCSVVIDCCKSDQGLATPACLAYSVSENPQLNDHSTIYRTMWATSYMLPFWGLYPVATRTCNALAYINQSDNHGENGCLDTAVQYRLDRLGCEQTKVRLSIAARLCTPSACCFEGLFRDVELLSTFLWYLY